MDEFTHKVAVVTGAGRGIGREIALVLASLGAEIAANDINPINLDETVSQIIQAGGSARPYVFDIAKRMPIEGMVVQVLADFGRIDILINHASVHPDAALLEMDEWEFHRTIDVNLGGSFFCMQQIGRAMREQGGGSIVNLITFDDKGYQHGHTAHSACQAALAGLTRAAASELSAYGIRVNAIYSGQSSNEFFSPSELDAIQLQAWRELHPQLLVPTHTDLVVKVAYLCSGEAVSMNGLILAARIT